MRKLLKNSDIIDIKDKLFNKELKKADIANEYGYTSISSLTLGLKAIGYKTVTTLKKIEK